MTFFFSISFTLNGSTRVTGLGTLRCGQREADQTKNHGDHEGMSAMLVRIEHHQTAWVGGDASRQENEQIQWRARWPTFRRGERRSEEHTSELQSLTNLV